MKLISLALAFLNGSALDQFKGVKVAARVYGLVAVASLVSCTFLLVALTILLAAEIGAVGACLVMSAIFAVVAVFGLLRAKSRKSKRKAMEAELIVAEKAVSAPIQTGIAVSAAAFMRGFLAPRDR